MPQSRAQKRNDALSAATPYDDLLCFNMYRGWRAIQELYASVFPKDFNPQRSYVIGLCLEHPTTVSQIAAVLQIDDAAVSNLIRRMENDGLVKRERSGTDGRSFEIHATEHGKATYYQAQERSAAIDQKLYDSIDTDDIAVLRRIVEAIHTHG